MDDALNPQTMVLFGISLVAGVYWLIAHASKAGILQSKRSKYLANMSLWALIISLFALAEGFGRSLYEYFGLWMTGTVVTLLFKAGAKDNERQEPENPQG